MKRKSRSFEIPAFERGLDHGGFEVAESAGGDLLYWRAAASEAHGIVFGGQIADERCDTILLVAAASRVFSSSVVLPEPGLETMLTTNTPRVLKALAEFAGDQIILLENVLADLDDAGYGAHSSTSRATTSSSLPLTISEARRTAFGAPKPLQSRERGGGVARGTETRPGTSSIDQLRTASGAFLHTPSRRMTAGRPSRRRESAETQVHGRSRGGRRGAAIPLRPFRRCSWRSIVRAWQSLRGLRRTAGNAASAAWPRLMPPSFGGTA